MSRLLQHNSGIGRRICEGLLLNKSVVTFLPIIECMISNPKKLIIQTPLDQLFQCLSIRHIAILKRMPKLG